MRCASENEKARLSRNQRAFALRSELLDIARALLAVTLSGESFLGAAFFAWLQVERVPLDFLNDILLLNFSLEAA